MSEFQTLPTFKEMKKQSMGETYKSLNQLIKGKSHKDFKNINELLLVKELPMFEESLKLILIDSFHLENEVIKIFLSQNDYQIKRILRCKWFFKNSLSEEYCRTQIFPYISVSLRCKIISRLSKYLTDEKEAEKFFQFIYSNYGRERAEMLLPQCSKEFILKYFDELKPLFIYNTSPRTILKISKRYPEAAVHILTEMSISDQFYDHSRFRKVFSYLAAYHSNIFTSVIVKYHSKMCHGQFGRKNSETLAPKIKELLFKSPQLLKSEIFNKKYLFKSFCFEDQVQFLASEVKFYLSNSVKEGPISFVNWKMAVSSIAELLRLVTPNQRLHIIHQTFKQLYNSNFDDYPNLWSPTILELILIEERRFYVEELEKLILKDEVENIEFEIYFTEPEKYIYLFEFNVAFEKFKKILLKASKMQKRETILKFMVQNCAINKDVIGLENLVDFVAIKYRNDSPKLLTHFLDAVIESFPILKLNSRIFEKLEDLSYFCALRGPSHCYTLILEKHILYRRGRKMDVSMQLTNFVNFAIIKRGYIYRFLNHNTLKESKWLFFSCCQEILKYIQAAKPKNDISKILLESILETCHCYNNFNKRDPIYLKEVLGLSEELTKQLKEHHGEIGGEDWPLDIWQKYYNSLMNSYSQKTFIMYILKRNPEIIVKNFDKILNMFLSSCEGDFNANFFIFSKKTFSFFEITDQVRSTILYQFKNGDSCTKRKNALLFYSHISNIDEFVEAIADFIPKNEKVDENAEFSEIQLMIARLIKNVKPRCKNLNLILKFFLGDFQKSVLPSYYSCSYYTRIDEIIPFLRNHLNNVSRKISFKKNIIRLIADLSTSKEKIDFCLACWEDNSHYSIRTVLLLFVSKFFLEQPSLETFGALEKCILDCDESVISARPDLNHIPKEFLRDYVSALWKYSEKQSLKSKNSFQNSLLQFFKRNNISLLSNEFCENIIKNNLFEPASGLKVDEFTIYYLVSDPSSVTSRTHMVGELLKYATQKKVSVSKFLKTLCKTSLEDHTFFAEVFDILLTVLQVNSFTFNGENIILIYYQLYLKVLTKLEDFEEKLVSVEFGKAVRNTFLKFESRRDLVIIFVASLTNFFKDLEQAKQPFNTFFAMKELIENSLDDKSMSIIGISVLPDSVVCLYNKDAKTLSPAQKTCKEDLHEMIKNLLNRHDEIVNAYLRWKFCISS